MADKQRTDALAAKRRWYWPRWLELLIFPWNDPAKQAEYDEDPDDLTGAAYVVRRKR